MKLFEGESVRETAVGLDEMARFDALVAHTDPAMYVVTLMHDGEWSGCLVGFASQCSIDPRRFVVWLSVANRTGRLARSTERLCVHVLRSDDHHLARVFGGETGDEVDKFAIVECSTGPFGVPVIGQCDWFVGRVIDRIDDGGDHVGCVLDPISVGAPRREHPVLRHREVRDIQAGHDA